MFFDNTTRAFGNDSSVPYRAPPRCPSASRSLKPPDPSQQTDPFSACGTAGTAGYQTSPHVVAILGSEDWYGYSYGWGGDEVALGRAGMLGTQHSGTT